MSETRPPGLVLALHSHQPTGNVISRMRMGMSSGVGVKKQPRATRCTTHRVGIASRASATTSGRNQSGKIRTGVSTPTGTTCQSDSQ